MTLSLCIRHRQQHGVSVSIQIAAEGEVSECADEDGHTCEEETRELNNLSEAMPFLPRLSQAK